MARICQKIPKRFSTLFRPLIWSKNPHIVVSLCYSLAKKAKSNCKSTFKPKWGKICLGFSENVQTICFIVKTFTFAKLKWSGTYFVENISKSFVNRVPLDRDEKNNKTDTFVKH